MQRYVAELTNILEHCEFNDQLVEKMLREQLVCGVNNERIQQRLLAEGQLGFKKTMELATVAVMETADRNTRDLKHRNPNGNRKNHKLTA